jgi:hypothetical protein
MFIKNRNDIRLSAEGMIRNFGDQAAWQADARAKRYAKSKGQKLWLAIAREIRAIRPQTNIKFTSEPSIHRQEAQPQQ